MIKLIFLLFLIPSLIYGGVYFDGVDDKVSLGTNSSLDVYTSGYTLMCWVNLADNTTSQGLIASATGDNGGFRLMLRTKFNATDNHNNIDLAKSQIINQKVWCVIKNNVWTHIAVVQYYSGATPSSIEVFINGVSTGTFADTNNYVSAAGQTKVISDPGPTWGGHFKGQAGDIRIYNKVLSHNEIKSAMSRYDFADIYTKGIWRFNDNIGYDTKKTFDLSGNNNTGTHTGTSNGKSNPPILMQPIYAGD